MRIILRRGELEETRTIRKNVEKKKKYSRKNGGTRQERDSTKRTERL